MSSPTPITKPRWPSERVAPSLRRLAIETIGSAWLVAAITATIQTLIWSREERLNGAFEKYHRLPIDDLPSMLMMMPFGFMIYTLAPPGWLFWAGLGLSLWSRSRSFIFIAVGGAIMFGSLWPKQFEGMMGI